MNLNQNQLEGVVDITRRVSVRGGYRYVWSDTELQSLTSGESEAVRLNRHVGLAGFGFRLPRKADLSLDFEVGEGSRVYSRKDILDYRKVRLRGRYRPWDMLTVSGAFPLLNHENTRPDIDDDFENYGFTLSLSLAPAGGKRLLVNLEYSRSDLNSDILYLIPQTFSQDRSFYVEDSHYGNAGLDVAIIRDIRLGLGYGVLSTSGSRPLNYHQPHAGLVIPLNRRVAWTTEWRYYGYNDKEFSFQGFHNHLITAGLRFSY